MAKKRPSRRRVLAFVKQAAAKNKEPYEEYKEFYDDVVASFDEGYLLISGSFQYQVAIESWIRKINRHFNL
jgi:hypothetical protein